VEKIVNILPEYILFIVFCALFSGDGDGPIESQDREIAPISLPPFYQCRVRGRTGHAPRIHLKGMLHQELRIKSEDLFLEKHPFPGKCLYLFRKFQAFFVRKNCTQVPLCLNHLCLLTSTSAAKKLYIICDSVLK